MKRLVLNGKMLSWDSFAYLEKHFLSCITPLRVGSSSGLVHLKQLF